MGGAVGGFRELYRTKPYPATTAVRLFLFGQRAQGPQTSSSRLADVVAADGDRPTNDLKVHTTSWGAATRISDFSLILRLPSTSFSMKINIASESDAHPVCQYIVT